MPNNIFKLLKKKLTPNQKKLILDIRRRVKAYFVNVRSIDIERISNYEKIYPHVSSTKETLELILRNKASICRFGDAEFDICQFENKDDPYQKPSQELSERLQEILHHESKNNLLICIPPFNEKTNNLKNYYGSLSFWEYYWLNRFENVNQLLSHSSYSNSFVTRETIFYECDITMVKQVWHGRNVTFVYGNNGRFNAEHELFDGIKSKSEILIKPTNAFDDYNSILAECIKYETDTLFLIAAGPTATVLAFDLWKNGFQALDIGHLPNSYDEFLGRIISPEHIPLVSK